MKVLIELFGDSIVRLLCKKRFRFNNFLMAWRQLWGIPIRLSEWKLSASSVNPKPWACPKLWAIESMAKPRLSSRKVNDSALSRHREIYVYNRLNCREKIFQATLMAMLAWMQDIRLSFTSPHISHGDGEAGHHTFHESSAKYDFASWCAFGMMPEAL